MSNRAALIAAVLLACLVAADLLFDDGALLAFAGRQLIRLTEWVAFWR